MRSVLLIAAVLGLASTAGAAEPNFKITVGFSVSAAPTLEFQIKPDQTVAPTEVMATNPIDTAVRVSRHLPTGVASGSGTVVACDGTKSLILTNAHVVENDDFPVTVVHNRRRYLAKYVTGSAVSHPVNPATGQRLIRVQGMDLCLLTVDAVLPVAAIAETAPDRDEKLTQYGYGGRADYQSPTTKEGYVSYVPDTDSLTSTVPSQPGDSGSGLFNSRNELVGVTWGGMPYAGHQDYAVPLLSVRTFLGFHGGGLFSRLRGRLEARRVVREAEREAVKALEKQLKEQLEARQKAKAAKPPVAAPPVKVPPTAPGGFEVKPPAVSQPMPVAPPVKQPSRSGGRGASC